jgi:hypothetical protein
MTSETDIQYEVWQDGDMVATADSLSDAQHFMVIYGQDGPVEAKTAVTVRTPGFTVRTPAPEGEAWRHVSQKEMAQAAKFASTNLASPVVPVGVSREEIMTTPDIAGLCERLQMIVSELQGLRDVVETCREGKDTLERQAAELARMREEVRYLRNMVGQTQSDICPVDPAEMEKAFAAIAARAALTGEDHEAGEGK